MGYDCSRIAPQGRGNRLPGRVWRWATETIACWRRIPMDTPVSLLWTRLCPSHGHACVLALPLQRAGGRHVIAIVTATLLWEQLSRANREAIQPLCNSAVFSRQFIVLSIESSPSVSASRKPVMSPSYPHSAAFAALALCNPYSEVPPPARTRGAGAQSHSSGTGHLLLSWEPDCLRQDV